MTATDAIPAPEPTRGESLIAMLGPFGVWDRLLLVEKPAVIVADPDLIAALSHEAPPERAHLVSTLAVEAGDLPEGLVGPWFVVTARQELAVKHRLRTLLRARGVQAEVYGALQDLVPMAIGEDETPERAGLEAKWESFSLTPSLVITCTPRSGSQFLVRKFQEQGIGAPREHVRPGVIALFTPHEGARIGGLGFAPFLAGLAHHAQRNGVFATKLISHFIHDLEDRLTPAEWALLDGFVQASQIIYLLRSNKLLQGLSRDRAETIEAFHVFRAENRQAYRERSQDWTYDYDRMLREIRLINTEEAYLLAWLRRLVEPSKRVPVPYESLDIDVEIRRWQERFGVTSGGTATPMETHILRDDLTRDYAARFAADYRQAYRADNPGTHVAHWVVYNPETDSLDSRTDPDSMVLPG